MCRLAWQRPRPPWHASQRPRHALQRPRHAWQRPRPPRHAFSQGPRSPTSKINPPTCCLINCEVKGVVYHQASIYGSVHTIFVKDKSHDNEIV